MERSQNLPHLRQDQHLVRHSKNHLANQPSISDQEEMMKDFQLAQLAKDREEDLFVVFERSINYILEVLFAWLTNPPSASLPPPLSRRTTGTRSICVP